LNETVSFMHFLGIICVLIGVTILSVCS
jgi:hypothetical protein